MLVFGVATVVSRRFGYNFVLEVKFEPGFLKVFRWFKSNAPPPVVTLGYTDTQGFPAE